MSCGLVKFPRPRPRQPIWQTSSSAWKIDGCERDESVWDGYRWSIEEKWPSSDITLVFIGELETATLLIKGEELGFYLFFKYMNCTCNYFFKAFLLLKACQEFRIDCMKSELRRFQVPEMTKLFQNIRHYYLVIEHENLLVNRFYSGRNVFYRMFVELITGGLGKQRIHRLRFSLLKQMNA